MDTFQYISKSAPDEALSLFRSYSNLRVRDEDELANGLKAVFKNLSNEDKQEFLSDMASIHPDKDLLQPIENSSLETAQPQVTNNAHCNCPHCQAKFGANGQSAVSHFMSSGDFKTNSPEIALMSKQVDSLTQQNNTKKIFNEKIFQLFVLGIALFLIYKHVIKK